MVVSVVRPVLQARSSTVRVWKGAAPPLQQRPGATAGGAEVEKIELAQPGRVVGVLVTADVGRHVMPFHQLAQCFGPGEHGTSAEEASQTSRNRPSCRME